MTCRVPELGCRVYNDVNGNEILIKYHVPRLEPDTAETLEADGLIKTYHDDGEWIATDLIEPDNLRVIAWVISINKFCRASAVPQGVRGL
jgi:hypothetical protein